MNVKVPLYAKKSAMKGLRDREKFPPSLKPGLEKSEARKLGIRSGVERAKQLTRSKYISEEDAKSIGAFYDRFKNLRTKRSEIAINLWGGRRFGRQLSQRF